MAKGSHVGEPCETSEVAHKGFDGSTDPIPSMMRIPGSDPDARFTMERELEVHGSTTTKAKADTMIVVTAIVGTTF